MSLANYTSRQAEPQLLKEGDNVVSLLSFVESASNMDVRVGADGKLAVVGMKAKATEWKNNTPCLVFHLGNDTGSLVHRAYEKGWDRYSDLTDEQKASGLFVEVKTFACTQVNGQLERVENTGHTETCAKKIGQILFAMAGGVAGVDGQEILDGAIATKSKFIVTVKKEPYKDPETGETTSQMIVINFKPLSSGVKTVVSDIPASLQA